jgi:hypothetical protein
MGGARGGAALGMSGWLALAGCDRSAPSASTTDGGIPTDGTWQGPDAW